MKDQFYDVFRVRSMLSTHYGVPYTGPLEEGVIGFDVVLGFRPRRCFIEMREDGVRVCIPLGIAPYAYPRVFERFALLHEIEQRRFAQDIENDMRWSYERVGVLPPEEIAHTALVAADYDLRQADPIIELIRAGHPETYLLQRFEDYTQVPLGGVH